jgi:hypothetical protein
LADEIKTSTGRFAETNMPMNNRILQNKQPLISFLTTLIDNEMDEDENIKTLDYQLSVNQ